MKILIAEDDPSSRALMEMGLTDAGFEVETADNGLIALEKAKAAPPDLIVSDVMMPQMDGYLLCRRVKESPRLRKVPVILYTATKSEKDEERLARVMGAAKFVSKLAGVNVLVAAIREELEKSITAAATPIRVGADVDQDYLRILSRKLQIKEQEVEEMRASLEASEGRYRRLFENMLEGLAYCRMIYDERGRPADWVYIEVNAAFERITGLKNAAGKNVSGLIPGIKESNPELFEIYGGVAATGMPQEFEAFVKPMSKWFRVSAFRPAEGHFVAIFEDITRQKLADETLKASEAKYRKIFENVQDVYFRTDMDGIIAEVSQSIERYAGYTREELLGRTMADLYADPQELAGLLNALRSNGEVNDFQADMITKDGRQACGSISAHLLFDERGVPAGVEGALRDIRERRRMEEEIKLKEIYLDNATDAVFVRDLSGNFFYVNETACKNYGWSQEEFLKMNQRSLLAPESAEHAEAGIKELAEKGDAVFENVHLKKDGSRMPVEVHSRIINVHDEEAVLSVARDITERKLAESRLHESSERLRRVEKLDSIGQLSGGIAHDLNNLLGPILGYADFLRKSLASGDARAKDVDEIIKAADRAAALVRQLLAFSRRQVLEPRVVSLNSIITDIGKMLDRVMGEHIRLVYALEPALGLVKVDPGQLERVLVNLAVNARDAMPDGGTITISTAVTNAPGPDAPPGRYVMLSVRDTGCGMDESVRARVFEPFFSTKPQGKGVGLGLSTVYGIVRQSGGDIQLESRPGEGTVFRIYLPLAAAETAALKAEAAPPRVPAPPPAPQGKRGTVLLVEDDESMRRITRRILTGAGYEVMEAINGKAALKFITENNAPPALMITDMIMPEMDGLELSQKALQKYPGMKTLYISGYADREGDLTGALGAQAAYLPKPFSPDALLNKINQLMSASA